MFPPKFRKRTSTVPSHAVDCRVDASLIEAPLALLAGACGADRQAQAYVEEEYEVQPS